MAQIIQTENSGAVRRWIFTEAEMQRCQELVHAGYPFAVLIYQLELRPNMDYETGVVGIKRRLCELGLITLLERQVRQGSRHPKKVWNRHKIQRQLKALVKFGLIEREGLPMVFRLPLAFFGSLRAVEVRTDVDTTNQAPTPRVSSILSEKSERRCAPSLITIQHQHAEVILQAYKTHLPALAEVRVLSDKLLARMADLWGCDERHQDADFWNFYFGVQCRKSGFATGLDFDQRKGPFKANLMWLLDRDNFERIMNGELS